MTDFTKSNDTEEIKRTFCNLWKRVRERLENCIDLDNEVKIQTIKRIDHEFSYQYEIQLPYGICFTLEGDSLHQWQEYGDMTRGVSLGFEFDWFKGIQIGLPHPSTIFRNSIGCHKIIYDSKKLEDEFFDICHDCIIKFGYSAWFEGIMPTFRHYSAFIKNPTFDIEKEIRIAYYPSEIKNKVDNLMSLTNIIKKPFPHVCFPWANGNGDNALRHIIMGCNCTLKFSDVKEIIEGSGLRGNIECFQSNCSYRIRK